MGAQHKAIMQTILSLIVMCFCLYKVAVENTNTALYWSGVTAILGYWLPSPSEADRHLPVTKQSDE